MEQSRTLIVLPHAPSAATPHVVAALAVAARAAPELAPFSVVCSWADFLEGRTLSLDLWREDYCVRSSLASQQINLSCCADQIFEKVQKEGFQNFVIVGGKKESLNAFALQERASEHHLKWNIQFIPDDETNSVGGTDHCLGYGSFSESFANWIVGEDFDNYSFFHGVKILIAPGQDTGWVALASSMSTNLGASRSIPHIGPHVVCLPEHVFCPSAFVEGVLKALKEAGRATVVVSEGVASQILSHSEAEYDNAIVALRLSEYLTSLLRDSRERFPELEDVRVRSENGWASRHVLKNKVSDADRAESYVLGMEAIQKLMRQEPSGMVGLRRNLLAEGYQCEPVSMTLETALFRPHKIPLKFLSTNNVDSRNEFFSYLKPLWTCTSSWKEASKAWGKSRAWQRPAWAQQRPTTPEFVQA